MAPKTEDYNKDELVAPEWLDNAFFNEVLQNCEKNIKSELKLKNVIITPATKMGDHYASVMFRAAVEYQCDGVNRNKSLIIKTMPELDGHKKDLLSQSYIFETEIGMYTEVLARFERILRAVGDKTVLRAPCLYHAVSPRKLIIFEDIVPQGYLVLRDRCPNKVEVEAAYKKLAKWHAISYKLHQEEPQYFENYRHNFMSLPNMVENDFMKDGITNFVAMLDEVPTLREYKPYFESIGDRLLQKTVASFKEYREAKVEGAPYVLCHGDFHFKNMMCKHDPTNGKLVDLMLIDFQLTYIGSIALDLIYSYYLLLDSKLRNDFPEFLYHYYTHFVETLQKIGYEGPVLKLSDIQEERRRHKHFELFLLTTFLPMWYSFRDGKIDPEVHMKSADSRKSLYRNQEYIDEVHIALRKYLHAGYLENI